MEIPSNYIDILFDFIKNPIILELKQKYSNSIKFIEYIFDNFYEELKNLRDRFNEISLNQISLSQTYGDFVHYVFNMFSSKLLEMV